LVTKVDVFVTVEKSYVLLRQHFCFLVLKVMTQYGPGTAPGSQGVFRSKGVGSEMGARQLSLKKGLSELKIPYEFMYIVNLINGLNEIKLKVGVRLRP
jgi:hypothetical protein